MPLDAEVGLGPCHIVLDGDPAPPPQFLDHVCCGQTAGWIKMPLGREGDTVLDGDPAPPLKKGGTAAPHFWAHVYVAKQLNGSGYHLVQR